jgi:putative heme-binding domain-containing protein
MLKGDATRGQALFTGKGQCQNCHSVAGVGARGGPSLSEVGASRRAIELQRAILEPSADIRLDHRPARVVMRDGATITGRLLNQDTFTVQVLDNSGRLRLLDRSTVREFAILKESPMPSYKGKLEAQEIADLVTYLTTLKGRR